MVFNEVFLSDGTAISMSLQVLFLWPLITVSGLLAAISLSVCISVCISQSIVASLFFNDHRWFMFIPLVCPILGCCSADVFQCIYAAALLCL